MHNELREGAIVWVSVRPGANEGRQGIRRAGRFFHNDRTVRFQVVPCVDPNDPNEPLVAGGNSSMDQITNAGLAALAGDHRLIVHDRDARARHLAEARAEAGADLKEISRLERELTGT